MDSVVLLGAGKMGRAIARELLHHTEVRLTVSDAADGQLSLLENDICQASRSWLARTEIVAADEALARASSADGIILSVPWTATRQYLEQLLRPADASFLNGVVVSITRPDYADFGWLQAVVKESGRAVYLPMGLEPGMVELVAAFTLQNVADISRLTTYCGGVPRFPKLPLCHELLFGDRLPTDSREAWYIRRGVSSVTTRFEDLKPVVIDGVGVLEAYHDGMMPTTAHDSLFKNLIHFEQRTVRWPGFVQRIATLKELGFFCDDQVAIDGGHLAPVSEVTHRVLARLMEPQREGHDITVLHVVAERENGEQGTITVVGRGNTGTTAMSVLTSVMASMTLRHAARERLKGLHLPFAGNMLVMVPALIDRLKQIKELTLSTSGIVGHIFS